MVVAGAAAAADEDDAVVAEEEAAAAAAEAEAAGFAEDTDPLPVLLAEDVLATPRRPAAAPDAPLFLLVLVIVLPTPLPVALETNKSIQNKIIGSALAEDPRQSGEIGV